VTVSAEIYRYKVCARVRGGRHCNPSKQQYFQGQRDKGRTVKTCLNITGKVHLTGSWVSCLKSQNLAFSWRSPDWVEFLGHVQRVSAVACFVLSFAHSSKSQVYSVDLPYYLDLPSPPPSLTFLQFLQMLVTRWQYPHYTFQWNTNYRNF
jgi:hypothetical protein